MVQELMIPFFLQPITADAACTSFMVQELMMQCRTESKSASGYFPDLTLLFLLLSWNKLDLIGAI